MPRSRICCSSLFELLKASANLKSSTFTAKQTKCGNSVIALRLQLVCTASTSSTALKIHVRPKHLRYVYVRVLYKLLFSVALI